MDPNQQQPQQQPSMEFQLGRTTSQPEKKKKPEDIA
jgi:hypothetical protein